MENTKAVHGPLLLGYAQTEHKAGTKRISRPPLTRPRLIEYNRGDVQKRSHDLDG